MNALSNERLCWECLREDAEIVVDHPDGKVGVCSGCNENNPWETVYYGGIL